MKIAIEARPIKWSYGTGIGNYTYCLIEKLCEIDAKNDYTFLWPDNDPYHCIPFSKKYNYYSLPKDDLREEVEIPFWLSLEKADLFHLPQNGFRTPNIRSTKLVVTIHDLIPYVLPEIVRPSFLKRFISEMPFIVERADHIITVSQASKNDIINVFGVVPEKISVVPSAPSLSFHPLPPTETKQTLINRFQLKKPFILYVGGLNPRKNVMELIYAYSKIYRDLPDRQQLVILGPNSKHRDQLESLVYVLELGNDVLFPGFVNSEDLPLFYNGADLFVYPSLYEGFGLPPIEAMACGTPVITSNVSSLPEVVGDAAIQVNPYDTLQLAEAIFRILSNQKLRTDLIDKGLRHSIKYDWNNIATQILEIYKNVVNNTSIPMAAGR